MSPEQVRGLAVDPRSDIFSFGTILYEMSSGQRAFESDSTVETMSAILQQDPPRLSDDSLPVSPALQRIMRRCLEKNRVHRFQSAKDLGYALEAVSGLSPNLPQAVTPAHRHRLSVLIGSAALAVLVIAGVIALRALSRNAPSFRQITYRQGSLQAARFGPDGVSMIYSAQWEGGPPQIQTSRMGDFEFRSLGLPAGTLAAVSSQGQIAMLLGCEPFFVSDCGGTLAQVPAAGSAPRELLEHVHYADWSPDGKSLAVVVQEPNGRNRLEYPIGHLLYETSGWIATPRISPDGQLIAFASHPLPNDDRGDVAVVDTAGRVRTLASSMASIEGVAWRSAKEVWFAASGGPVDQSAWSDSLYSVDLKANTRLVAHFPGIIRLHDISNDGKVLFSREAWRQRMFGLFPGDAAEHAYSWLDWSVSMGSGLSADGKMLLFTEAGAAASDEFVPYLRPTNGSSAVRLGKGAAIALSPDGKWAAVVDLVPERLSLLPTGAGNARAMDKGSIEQYDFAGWWSGDGKSISFAAQERGRGLSVYSQPDSGGAPRRVTPELQYMGMIRPHFAVSSDARLIAAIPAGASKIHLFDSSGNDLGELKGSHEDEVPAAFTADGRVLVGPRQGEWPLEFFVIDYKTGTRSSWKQFAPPDRAGLRTDWNISVTPDLRYYAYSLTQATSELYVMEGSK
jgi:Tol biopolymer transport system component